MRQQPQETYRGYRTAGIRLSEEPAAEMRRGGQESERAILYAGHMFDKAHVTMLVEEHLIPREAGVAILRAFREMEAEGADEVRSRIGGGLHAAEIYLIRKLGEDIGGREHLARSSGDLGAVAMRIHQRDQVLEVFEALSSLRTVLIALAGEHLDSVMPAYFHWQHAQPTTFGHYLTGIADALGRDATRIREAYARINRSPAGAVILVGSDFPINRERVAALLGFDGVQTHTMDAIQDTDHVLETFSVLAMMAAHLARLAEDLSFWAGTELQYIGTADRFANASSILNQMKTPTPTNQIKAAVAGVVGGMTAAYLTYKAGTGMSTLERKYALVPLDAAFEDALRNLRLLPPVLQSMTFNRDIAKQQAGAHFAAASDLAGFLVKDKDLPMRSAHQISAILMRFCEERGLTPDDVTPELLDEAAVEYFGRPVGLSQERIRAALDPARFVNDRTLTGGPAPSEVQRQLQELARAVQADDQWLEGRRASIRQAATSLEEAIDQVVSER